MGPRGGRRGRGANAQGWMSGGFMLDAGALIAIDRGDRRMLVLLETARAAEAKLSTTAPVVAQVWRDGKRQARLSAFVKQPALEVAPFDMMDARAVGTLVAATGHADVVDTHVVLLARRRGQTIVTSDAKDILAVDARIPVVTV